MTVGTEVKRCFSAIKGAQANVDMLANKTQDDETKEIYEEISETLLEITTDLEEQIIFISQQEPQYNR